MKYRLCLALLWVSSATFAQSTSHGEVTIYRDAMGVPHIVGATSSAVMYGLGYALAEDRLGQVEVGGRGAARRRPAGAVGVGAPGRRRPTSGGSGGSVSRNGHDSP